MQAEVIMVWHKLQFEELILKEKAVLPEYISWQVRKEDQIKPEACAMPERVNLWGYAPANYFAVKASYAKGQDAAVEWKKLIRALHENHMECVMEMYFPENVNQNLILAGTERRAVRRRDS